MESKGRAEYSLLTSDYNWESPSIYLLVHHNKVRGTQPFFDPIWIFRTLCTWKDPSHEFGRQFSGVPKTPVFPLQYSTTESRVGPLHFQQVQDPRRPDLLICSCFFITSPAVSLLDFATSFLCHLRSQIPMKSIGSTNGGGCGSGLVVVVDCGCDRITSTAIVLLW